MKLRPSRALAVTMTAGVLMSTAAVPAMAADSIVGPPIIITPPDPRHEQKYASEGVVSASISEADQQRLKDVGFDLSVTPNHDNVSIRWTFDEQRARDLTGFTDMGDEDADRLRVELGIMALNIHERDKQSPYPTMRAGEDTVEQSLAFTSGYRPGQSAVDAASVSSWRAGGVDGITEISTTHDTYREYDADRQAKVEAAGRRGHYLPNLSQCYAKVDVCGFYVTPVVTGSNPEVGQGNVTTRALTDSIWVSVDTRAGLPEPVDYTDAGGHEHVFTLNTSETMYAQDRLSTPWRNAPGRDEQNRVLPRFELERFWDHKDGIVRLGLRTSLAATHRLERVGDTNEYLLTVSAVDDLGDRAWSVRTDGLEGEVFAQDDQGRVVVSDVDLVSTEGQDVVLRLTLSSDDETLVPQPRVTSLTVSVGSGGTPLAQSFWQQPVYDEQVIEAPLPDPEYVDPPTGPRPPRDSSRIPLSCSGGWLVVAVPPGTEAGYIAPDGTYYPDLTREQVNERIAAAAPAGGYCPKDDEVVPPVVDVPEPQSPVEQPPVVDVPEAPEPEAPVASPEPPVVVVDQPRLDPAPQPEAEPVVAPAPETEDEPEFLEPLRPETGIDGIGTHESTVSSASPSLLSLLIAAATAVAGVVLYGGSRPIRLGRRYVARHARD